MGPAADGIFGAREALLRALRGADRRRCRGPTNPLPHAIADPDERRKLGAYVEEHGRGDVVGLRRFR